MSAIDVTRSVNQPLSHKSLSSGSCLGSGGAMEVEEEERGMGLCGMFHGPARVPLNCRRMLVERRSRFECGASE